MAKVHVQVVGGSVKELEADTVADVKTQLGVANHAATVNGEPETDDYELADFEFVSLAPSVKGA